MTAGHGCPSRSCLSSEPWRSSGCTRSICAGSYHNINSTSQSFPNFITSRSPHSNSCKSTEPPRHLCCFFICSPPAGSSSWTTSQPVLSRTYLQARSLTSSGGSGKGVTTLSKLTTSITFSKFIALDYISWLLARFNEISDMLFDRALSKRANGCVYK